MSALLSELVTYLIKFLAMLVFAFLGILAGKKIRSNKDARLAMEQNKDDI